MRQAFLIGGGALAMLVGGVATAQAPASSTSPVMTAPAAAGRPAQSAQEAGAMNHADHKAMGHGAAAAPSGKMQSTHSSADHARMKAQTGGAPDAQAASTLPGANPAPAGQVATTPR